MFWLGVRPQISPSLGVRDPPFNAMYDVFGPHKRTCQMASQSVERYKQRVRMWQTTDGQTTLREKSVWICVIACAAKTIPPKNEREWFQRSINFVRLRNWYLLLAVNCGEHLRGHAVGAEKNFSECAPTARDISISSDSVMYVVLETKSWSRGASKHTCDSSLSWMI